MALKKSELYSSLWKSCDALRGGMDASQYKDYVLTLLFIKYVSDKYANQNAPILKVPEGARFSGLLSFKGDPEIGDKINKAISKLATANELEGVIDIADFNDASKLGEGKEMQDRLSSLLSIFNDLNFGNNLTEGDDLLGDAYEYLMNHFATESGKSKGQFYTPAEVSRIMAKVIGIYDDGTQEQTVYDPTCGSGSLLLKVADEVSNKVTLYGQEKDIATTALAKMNMILHNNPSADIAKGGSSTLSNPAFASSESGLKRFDFVVANPPFSLKGWENGLKNISDPYKRFSWGRPPAKNGDYAFLLHIIHSLKSTGKGAVILPHGVLFPGNAEATIRKEIVQSGYIKGVIGLPANLFYGTGIPACIVVLDKENSKSRKGIFMIDASKGFIKDGNKNRLRAQDIHKIVTVFNEGQEIAGFSRLVPIDEIKDPKNGYNLNLPRYIDGSIDEDIYDLTAHLNGGIPNSDINALQPYWDVFSETRKALFKPMSGKNGECSDYLMLRIPADQIRMTILDSDESKKYAKNVEETLKSWQNKYEPYLKSLKKECKPKEVIKEISEDLLSKFSKISLIDKYDVYQHLMNYWSEIMQDDLYQISLEGWKDAVQIREVINTKDKEKKVQETPDLVLGTGKKPKKFKIDLIPPALIVERYYPEEKKEIDELEAENEKISGEIEEFIEEYSGEEDFLEYAKNDKGELTKENLDNRIKEIKGNEDFKDEMHILKKAKTLLDK